jgi:hypothetical protein
MKHILIKAALLTLIHYRCRLVSRVILSGCLAAFGSSSILAQGSLTPAGAPAPTMKTLDQIEARTPVDATHTPGDSGNSFIISQPGSYYLTGNVNGVANKNGINIQADSVTLDLNGFALIGPVGSGSGIIVENTHSAIAIHNGTVRNWYNGVLASTATDSVIGHIRAVNNTPNYGIAIGVRGLVSDCTSQGNAIGINADNDSSITNGTAQGNSLYGITRIREP